MNPPATRKTDLLKTTYELDLQEKINAKIEAIRNIENDIPCIIIVHDLRNFHVVYISQKGLDILQTTLEEVRSLGKEYFERYFNAEDIKTYLPKFMGLMECSVDNETFSFFQQVRPSKQHEWAWYSSCSKVLLRDTNGRPILTITTAIPIDEHHFFSSKVDRLLEENNFLHKNQHLFTSLTKREKEILKLMALGTSSEEMAAKLHISRSTADTHRRNIRSKIKVETPYDIMRFAQAFNLI
jgi:DNA-binding CsgD family transcriptional regulator